MNALAEKLRSHGIQPSAQRLAVAKYVLTTPDHPSAEQVWKRVQRTLPMISRATVYNTLNLFVLKGLVREVVLRSDRVLFDPNTGPHHHFVDETTGRIHDVPFDSIEVIAPPVDGFEIGSYEVILRGRKRHRQ